MDSRMRDGNLNRKSRNQPRVSSGARNAPYARPAEAERPSNSRMHSADAWKEEPKTASWPPAQLSIRGSSGPPTVVVSNLMLGTTGEDVRMTFEQFGQVIEVYQRPPPSQNYPSVAFEVSFKEKEDAFQAIDKFDGALADGRILGVQFKSTIGDPRSPGHDAMQRQLASADSQRRGPDKELLPSPGPLPRAPSTYDGYNPQPDPHVGTSRGGGGGHQHFQSQAPPTGPRAAQNQTQQRPHHQRQQNGKGKTSGTVPTGPKHLQSKASSAPVASTKPLASRLLTPAQAKQQAIAEASRKKKAQAQALLWAKQKQEKLLAGKKGGGKVGGKSGPLAASLKDRLGSVPLAQRLAAESQKTGAKSDAKLTPADQEKKAAKLAKLKAKRAAKKAEKKAGGAAVGMEVD